MQNPGLEFETAKFGTVTLQVGNYLQDMDPRTNGRTLRVERIDPTHVITSFLSLSSNKKGRVGKISIRRLVKTYGHRNGFVKV